MHVGEKTVMMNEEENNSISNSNNDFATLFCGESEFDSSSCTNQSLTICFCLLLWLVFLFAWLKKSPPKLSQRSRPFSAVQIVSAVFNGCVGLSYFVLGAWELAERLREFKAALPLSAWLSPLFQGLTWSAASLTLTFGASPPRPAAVACFLFAAFVCATSAFDAFSEQRVAAGTVLGILSLPGGFLLLWCCVFRKREDEEVEIDGEHPYSPLVDGGDSPVVTPFAEAGLFGKLSFWWLNPTMTTGRRKVLEESNIPKLRDSDRAESCYSNFLHKLENQNQNHEGSKMLRTIVQCYWQDILVSGLFALVKILTLSSGPLLLNEFILVAEGKSSFKYEGYALALTLFLSKLVESVSMRQWYFRSRLVGLRVRSLITAAVYRKQLRLSNTARLRYSGGEISSLVAVDAYRVGEFPFWLHQTWTTGLQLTIALGILIRAVGPATLAALAAIIITVACNAPLAKLQHRFSEKLMAAQDERMRLAGEALVNMRVLKLYAWEGHFRKAVEGLRKVEERWLSGVQISRSYNTCLFWSSPLLVSAATFGACYFLNVPLRANNVFTFVATLRLVQDPIRSIPDVIAVVIQAKVGFGRIVEFLSSPELHGSRIRKRYNNNINDEAAVVIESADFSWDENLSKPTLRNISLKVGPAQKVAVCGEVGSGKSTILAAILGEVPCVRGKIQVYGRIAYVSQTAWIQTGTLRDNILFGSPMDSERYQEVIERCSLVKDLELLPHGDMTEIGERGVNLSGGQKQRIQLARSLYQNADIYLLDDPFSAVDAHTATSLFNEYVMEALSEKTVLLVTHQVDFLPALDSVLLMSDGEIIRADSYSQLLSTSREFQDLVNAHKETAGIERLANMTPADSKSHIPKPAKEIKKSFTENNHLNGSKTDKLIKQEEREIGDTGLTPYKQYLNQNKGYLYYCISVISHIVFVVGQISQNTWMALSVDNPETTMLKMIVVYLIIGLGSAFFLFTRSLAGVTLASSSSRSLFSQLMHSLFRAPMSFYDSTPLGRILSRISADISIVDLDVPFSLMVATGASLNCLANLGVLAGITWQVLFVSVPMIFIALKLQRYYFSTAKELMRINGTTKSLVVNHLSESVAGVVTIRAFEQEERFFAKNLELIDVNASPFFHSFAANEWLILRLETLSAAVLAAAAFCMVLLPTDTFSSGFIGMALSYGLSLNMSLVFSIQNQCTLANYIISVERLNQYMHIPSEAPEVIEENRPPANWPSVGKVEIRNLLIRYRPNAPLVLRGISCTFSGGHKIGIVGRTGSGKTTLIGALFRLVEPAGGQIVIDGIDITTIGLHDLRSRFGVIPQDPTLFNGTVRYNLDPLSQHTDQKIWEVLGKCQLREAVQEKEEGLDSLVVDDGSNWSMGQRQLFCLGRALLRRSRILVLDEATASIDNATDLILQKTIRTEFADCTVITVAHRIPTVMDCTMVLAMSEGEIVEYDEPMELMKREGSLFRNLVKEYWSHSVSVESH